MQITQKIKALSMKVAIVICVYVKVDRTEIVIS
jgi:hypothetical protein